MEELLEAAKVSGNRPAKKGSDWTAVLVWSVSAAILGGSFQLGFVLGNMANTLDIVKTEFGVGDGFLALLVSGNPIGGLFGGLSAGYLADIWGRRTCMMWNCVPMVVGAGLMAIAYNQYVLLCGRIVVGFAVGIGSGLTPMYLSEIAPVKIRGAVGTSHGLVLTIGTLVGFLLSVQQVIGDHVTNKFGWRLFFALPMLPAVYQTIVLFFCPESPTWLLFNQNNRALAGRSLVRLRSNADTAAAELQAMLEDAAPQKTVPYTTFLTDPTLRLSLLVGVGLHAAQQLSGINAVLSYTPQIFAESNVSNPTIATLATGGVNVLTALIAVPLMDRLGRRSIMLGGLALMALSYFGVAIAQSCNNNADWKCGGGWTGYLSVIMTLTFIVGFAGGAGSIPWLIVGEIFTCETRGKGSSICVGVNWTCNLIVCFTYDSLNHFLRPYTFFLYMGIVVFFFIFTLFFVPETRRKSVEEIHRRMEQQALKCPPIVL